MADIRQGDGPTAFPRRNPETGSPSLVAKHEEYLSPFLEEMEPDPSKWVGPPLVFGDWCEEGEWSGDRQQIVAGAMRYERWKREHIMEMFAGRRSGVPFLPPHVSLEEVWNEDGKGEHSREYELESWGGEIRVCTEYATFREAQSRGMEEILEFLSEEIKAKYWIEKSFPDGKRYN